VAAPRPEIRPAMRPFESVREKHKTFTGPTGAEMANPASTPLSSNSRAFIVVGQSSDYSGPLIKG
jgi:hypothetical protein